MTRFSYRVLRIPRRAKFRLEEHRQAAINLQESVLRDTDTSACQSEEFLFFEFAPDFGEFVEHLDAKLPAEIGGLDPPGFELQDHFADQALAIGDRQRAVQRQFTV